MAYEEKLRTLIEKIAKERSYDNCTILTQPISSGGANYSSYLFLATVSAPGKDALHMFAKIAAIGEELRASVPTEAFTIEHRFYMDLVKKFRQIEDKYNIKDEDKLVTAKFYGASGEYLYETLVLENLKMRGFQSFDRFQAIDWPYARYSIKQLALFHALSVALAKDDLEGYRNFMTKLMPVSKEVMSEFIKIDVDKTLRIIKEENRERVAKFLAKPEMREPMFHLLSAEGPVLVHGDYRPSNMMHKELSDGTTQVIVLDYQTLHEGSPVIDLLYFLFLSLDKKFRDQHLRQSFDYYYEELSSALKRFNLDPEEVYSKETYEADLKKNIPYMLSCTFCLLLVITIDEADGQITDNLDVLKKDIIPNDLYVERINDWVDDCIAMGVL
ncbi:uncharacterized protein LOC121737205 [Aricia agestis]|uniref:uncharacterized protein LOC121737205 n=1 Tax=Aricia agestis TaxID=91739 RepID=UPI001C209C01|nr:uncharacterized protein LOC121737205 [Aricia agestis]